MKNKQSKEIKKLEKAIQAYINKHKGNCVVSVSVSAFDKDSDVIDDQLWLFGNKETLKVDNECMLEEIEKIDK